MIKNYISQWLSSERKEHFIAAGILLVVLLSVFWQVVFYNRTFIAGPQAAGVMADGPYGYKGPRIGQSTLDPGAAAWIHEPLARKIKSIYCEGDLPFWNPNSGIGIPLLPQGVNSAFSLLMILFASNSFSSSLWDAYYLLRLFFAGFFCYIFLREIKVGFWGAVIGGLAFMLSGYFVSYLVMFHLEVELCFPALLWVYHKIFHEENISKGKYLLYILIIFMIASGGYMESVFLVMMGGGLYYIFYLVQDRTHWKRNILRYLLVSTIGGLLAAPIIFPFIELMKVGAHTHEPGYFSLNYGGLPLDHMLRLLMPFIDFGLNLPYNKQIAYIGVFPLLIGSLAISDRSMKRYVIFFGSFCVIYLSRTFGLPLTRFMDHIPLINMVIFYKYAFPVFMGLPLSVLVGIGINSIQERSYKPWHLVSSIIVLALLPICLLVGIYLNLIPGKSAYFINNSVPITVLINLVFYYTTLAFGAAILIAWGWRNYQVADLNKIKWIAISIIALITLISCMILLQTNFPLTGKGLVYQIFFNHIRFSAVSLVVLSVIYAGTLLILPKNFISKTTVITITFILYLLISEQLLYLPKNQAGKHNAYLPAPYITFLQNDPEPFRIVSSEGYLYPNISSVFNIDDVRTLYPINLDRYVKFKERYLSKLEPRDRFTAIEKDVDFNSFAYNLLNVKYILSSKSHESTLFMNYILENHRLLPPNDQYKVGLDIWKVGERTCHVLVQHPPSDMMVPVDIKGSNILRFSYGYSPAAWTMSGDGATFQIDVFDEKGTQIELFDKMIDPKNKLEDHRMFEGEIDLSRFNGQKINLLFRTLPGKNNSYDWIGWGDLRLDRSDGEGKFTLVYDDEIKIERNNQVMPRVNIVHRGIIPRNEEESLQMVDGKNVDLNKYVVLEGKIDDESILSGRGAPLTDGSRAEIDLRKANYVSINATMENEGFLVLLDGYYPGWKVKVDGEYKNIYLANYMYRGVYLEKGYHRVEFIFAPKSFYLGELVAIIIIIGLIGFICLDKFSVKKISKDL